MNTVLKFGWILMLELELGEHGRAPDGYEHSLNKNVEIEHLIKNNLDRRSEQPRDLYVKNSTTISMIDIWRLKGKIEILLLLSGGGVMKKTVAQIHYNMSRVRNKDSKIELILRKELWKRNLRYRKNVKDVFGKPDIVFLSRKIAVFVDSEFWHGYDWTERKTDFKTNTEFWINKIEKNIARDKEVTSRLQEEGWIVLRFWGKEILTNVSACADIIESTYKRRS